MSDYTLEHEVKLYNNDTGGHIGIQMDRDGLGLIEIVQVDSGQTVARVVMTVEEARIFSGALTSYLGNVTEDGH